MLNKLLFPEKFAHHVLLLFYLFREEEELVSGFSPMYENKQGGMSPGSCKHQQNSLNHMEI